MKIKDLLKKYELSVDYLNVDLLLKNFRSEMDNGLNNKNSSLAMLNSYLSLPKNLSNETVAIIDAGGTNLRIGLGSSNDQNEVEIYSIIKRKMPGKIQDNDIISSDKFYQPIVDCLKPIANKFTKIGFCFSYPTEILPNRDGKLLHWTKEVDIPDLVNQPIGRGLNNALNSNGIGNKTITILNDTVATLLSGFPVGNKLNINNYVGFILGTGTNSACIVNNQILNLESGAFSKFPISIIDDKLDHSSNNVGSYRFEKSISGEYIGSLTLKLAFSLLDEIDFSESANFVINNLNQMGNSSKNTLYFSEINNSLNSSNPFHSESFSKNDRYILGKLFQSIVDRASLFSAVNIASAVLIQDFAKNNKVCITIDGSTFYKTPNMANKTKYYLSKILEKKGIDFKLLKISDAPAIGAVIATSCFS